MELYYGDVPWEFDRRPFREKVYGRVPGAVNTKHNHIVRFIKTYEGPVTGDISEILEKRMVTVRKSPISVPKASTGFNPALFCGVIDYVRKKGKDVDYEVWQMAMGTLAKAGDMETALEIGTAKKTEQDVRSFFASGKELNTYTCMGTPKRFNHSPDTPCFKCPHYVPLSSPSFVSGRLPTPGALSGFHRMTSTGKGEEKEEFISPEKVYANSIVNHWINTNKDTHVIHGKTLYRWQGEYWENMGELVGRDTVFPHKILKELKAIPKYGLQTTASLNECRNILASQTDLPRIENEEIFDNTQYLNLKNGVLDLQDFQLYKHDKEFYMIEQIGVVYDPKATCPKWQEFLDYTMDEHSQKLLQVFMGLAVSSEANSVYQQYLWIKGYPGTGKSKILEVLEFILGYQKSLSRSASACQTKEGGVTFDYRGKTLFYIDDFKHSGKAFRTSQWESFINAITTGLSVPIRKLYMDAINAKPRCTCIITSNDDPPISTLDSGSLRRVRQIHFYKKVEKSNPHLMDDFKQEISGIFNWMLEGLKWYYDNGMPPKGPAEKALTETYEDISDDLVGTFCNKHLQKGDETFQTSALYNTFLQYMDIHPSDMSLQLFGRKLPRIIPSIIGKPLQYTRKRRHQGIVYTGLKIVKGTEGEEE